MAPNINENPQKTTDQDEIKNMNWKQSQIKVFSFPLRQSKKAAVYDETTN